MIIEEMKTAQQGILATHEYGRPYGAYKKLFESEKFNELLYQIIFELET